MPQWRNENPPRKARGLYVVFLKNSHVKYVGQGVLQDRLAEWPDYDHWWAIVASKAERLGIERYLIRVLEPSCNESEGEDVAEIQVNTPEVPLTEGAAAKLIAENYPL